MDEKIRFAVKKILDDFAKVEEAVEKLKNESVLNLIDNVAVKAREKQEERQKLIDSFTKTRFCLKEYFKDIPPIKND